MSKQTQLLDQQKSTSAFRKISEMGQALHGLDETKEIHYEDAVVHSPSTNHHASKSADFAYERSSMRRNNWRRKLKARTRIWLPFVAAHLFILPTQILADSELRQALVGLHTPAYYIIYFLFVIASFTLYWVLFFSNPGTILRPVDDGYEELKLLETRKEIIIDPNHSIGMVSGLEEIDRKYCFICDIHRPPRSKHCFFCHRCVSKFDHHCPFLGTCIGGKNHRIFWWFLCIESIILLWTLAIEIEAISVAMRMGIGTIALFIYQILGTIVTTAFVIYCVPLFFLHTYIAIRNVTTYELILRYRARKRGDVGVPTGQYSGGILYNLRQFCGASMREEWVYPEPRRDF